MQTKDDRIIAAVMEQLIESGPDGLGAAFAAMLNPAMRIERDRHPTRDRRAMDRRGQSLPQHEKPGCLEPDATNLQTKRCSISAGRTGIPFSQSGKGKPRFGHRYDFLGVWGPAQSHGWVWGEARLVRTGARGVTASIAGLRTRIQSLSLSIEIG